MAILVSMTGCPVFLDNSLIPRSDSDVGICPNPQRPSAIHTRAQSKRSEPSAKLAQLALNRWLGVFASGDACTDMSSRELCLVLILSGYSSAGNSCFRLLLSGAVATLTRIKAQLSSEPQFSPGRLRAICGLFSLELGWLKELSEKWRSL